MKIGILQCDHVNELFREQFDDYPEMFINLLSAVAPQLEFEVFSLIDGEFPESLDSCDAWLITGSRHGTYEDLPWIHRLGELIRQLDADKRKVVGICFGHQMIAQALGGESGKSDKGWGVGLQTWRLCEKPAWMSEDATEFSLLASHQDQVRTLPPGAKRIAGSDFCENAAFQLGEHILTFQGHPEFVADYSRALMEFRSNIIPADTLETGMASLERQPDSGKVGRWMVKFLGG